MTSYDPETFISELIMKIGGHHGTVIFRGENANYPEVSSNLYRDPAIKTALHRFGIRTVEQLELENASRHAPRDMDYHRLRALLQHYHGKTNAIDFTTDINIALFFACHGKYGAHGRIICIDRDNTTCEIDEPEEPAQRTVAQRSVFVLPPRGFVPPNEYRTIKVPAKMKPRLLAHLHRYYGISIRTVYHDLLGYIHYRNNNESQTIERNAEALDLMDSGNPVSAIAVFQESINLDPENELTYQLRASAYQQAGKPSTAIRDLNHAIRLLRFNPEAYALRALCHHEIGTIEAGLRDADTAIQQDPEFSIAYNTRGLLLVERGDLTEAFRDFSKAINLNPDFAIARNNRGFTLMLQELPDEAMYDFDAAIASQEDLAIAYLNRSVACVKLGNLSQARQDIETAVSLDPELENIINSNDVFFQFRNG